MGLKIQECNVEFCKAKCCQNISVLSEKEIQRIKNYIRKNNIKPVNRNNILTQTNTNKCPFLNEDYKCNIYSVRPEICRWFHCSSYKKNEKYLDHSDKSPVDLMDTFFPGSYNPKDPEVQKEFEKLVDGYKEKRKTILKEIMFK